MKSEMTEGRFILLLCAFVAVLIAVLPCIAVWLSSCPHLASKGVSAGDLLGLYGSAIGVMGALGAVWLTRIINRTERRNQISPRVRMNLPVRSNGVFEIQLENLGNKPIYDVFLEGVPFCQVVSPRQAEWRRVMYPAAPDAKDFRFAESRLGSSESILQLFPDCGFRNGLPQQIELACYDEDRNFHSLSLTPSSKDSHIYLYRKDT